MSDNGIGVAGINQVSKIQPLRVLGKCGGYTSDIADAIRWSAGLPVTGIPNNNPTPDRVVNISLGGSGACDSVTQNAINAAVAAGTVVVVAAGNSNADAANFTPANCNNVITVAATGHTGSRAYYSNYGTSVEIAAPGGDAQLGKTILSTLNAGTQGPGADSYANYQGTSMATPHVVGIVSLMLSVNPSLTPAQVTTMLQSTATPFPAGSTCTTSLCGAGIVNAAAAVAAAKGGGGPVKPGRIRQDLAREHGIDRGHLVDAAVGPEPGAASYAYCVDTVNDNQCARHAWVNVAGGDVGHGVRPRAGHELLLAGAGRRTPPATRRRTAAPGGRSRPSPAPTPPAAFSKTSPANGARNQRSPVTLRWAASAGATVVRVVRLDCRAGRARRGRRRAARR